MEKMDAPSGLHLQWQRFMLPSEETNGVIKALHRRLGKLKGDFSEEAQLQKEGASKQIRDCDVESIKSKAFEKFS